MNLRGTPPERFGPFRSWGYRRFVEPAFEPLYREVAAALRDGHAGGAILDLGCGTGRLAELLAAALPGARIVGADREGAMLRHAAPRARGSLAFVRAEGSALPFPDGAFGLVLATLSLHHWEEPAEVLAEVARVLRPGGRFLALDADPEAPDDAFSRGLARRGPFLLPLFLLRRILRKHGFDSRECEELVVPALRGAGLEAIGHRPFLWVRWVEGARSALAPARAAEGQESAPVRVPLEDALDLHSFQPRETAAAAAAYLDAAAAAGFREVRLIHGRGIGAQREIIRALCARHPSVESFSDAPPERGGWGATVVRLRPVVPGAG